MPLATIVKQARDAVAIPFNRIFGDPNGDGSRLMDLSGLLDTTATPINPAKEDGNLATLASAITAGTMKTVDQNGAAFGTATAMTAGSAYTAGRSVGINATAAGNITLTTSGGSIITLPIYVGWNTYPFAVTSFAWPSSGAGAGSVFNLS